MPKQYILLTHIIQVIGGLFMEYKLRLNNISKVFNGEEPLEAIKNITFDVKNKEIVSIVGTSGCGKSTLLNIISGLDESTNGEILFDKEKPRISYMLQSDALLPYRTVYENAILGLELLHEDTKENKEYVLKLLEEYGLKNFIDKKPNELSGGMRQRVSLIRSIAIKPDILLLDEPFSALDYYTRITISNDVKKIIESLGITTIIITHDIAEALSLSSKIIVLSSRPSVVKNIYNIEFNSNDAIERRSEKNFNGYYEKIWRDLDVNI